MIEGISHGRLQTLAVVLTVLAVLLYLLSFFPSAQGLGHMFFGFAVAGQIFVALALIGRADVDETATDHVGSDEIRKLQDDLAAARQDLAAKSAEIERFTYIVSHDLRSPLLTIQGFSDILKMDVEEGKTEAIDEDLGHIFKATQRMRQLLDDLLELSRIGRFNEPASKVPLSEVAGDALKDIQELVDEKNAQVDIDIDLPTLEIDRGRIQQLMRNLLDNAIRYGEEDRVPEVRVSRREIDHRLEIFVEDNGSGLEPEQLESVFGPFERFSADSIGTGMGLAHAQRIVAYHGGSIRAESSGKGEGCTIFFTLSTPRDAVPA